MRRKKAAKKPPKNEPKKYASAGKHPIPAELLEDRILSPAVVAQLDGVHVRTVWRQIKAGKLKTVRVSANRIGVRTSVWRAAREDEEKNENA